MISFIITIGATPVFENDTWWPSEDVWPFCGRAFVQIFLAAATAGSGLPIEKASEDSQWIGTKEEKKQKNVRGQNVRKETKDRRAQSLSWGATTKCIYNICALALKLFLLNQWNSLMQAGQKSSVSFSSIIFHRIFWEQFTQKLHPQELYGVTSTFRLQPIHRMVGSSVFPGLGIATGALWKKCGKHGTSLIPWRTDSAGTWPKRRI